MKVLVTGTSGFIGAHVANYLTSTGDIVLGLDNRAPLEPPRYRHVTCDLLDARALERIVADFKPAAVLHLAARTDIDPSSRGANPHGTKAGTTSRDDDLLFRATSAGGMEINTSRSG